MEERLNKFLSRAGICSRRKAELEILAGNVKVNNKIVKELGTKINPKKDIVEYYNRTVKVDESKVYYAINKPVGYVSTTIHSQDEKIVTDLVSKNKRLYPVGRLDKASEGLMILTNDGELALKLTHPKYNHEKEYSITAFARTEIRSIEKIKYALSRLEKGIVIDKDNFVSAKIKNLEINPHNFRVSFNLILTTGVNHQIRKMTEKVGLSIDSLRRVRINKLMLGELKSGECKKISREEII